MITISSTLIIKNEMPYIMDLLNQLSNCTDEVIVVDTGSTDGFRDPENLLELPRNVKVYYHDWKNDFAEARNASLSFCSSDFIFTVDGDDYLNDSLVAELNEFRRRDLSEVPDAISVPYQYWMNSDMCYDRIRLVKRTPELKWGGRIHENLNVRTWSYDYFSRDCKVMHLHQKEHTDRNLKIFHAMDSDCDPMDYRDIYNYAMELYNCRYFIPAIQLLEHVVMDKDAWMVYRIAAIHNIKIATDQFNIKYNNMPDYDTCICKLYNDACIENSLRSDLLCDRADIAFKDKDYQLAKSLYQMAYELGAPEGRDDFLCDSKSYTWHPCIQLMFCNWELGNKGEAALWNDRALKYLPTNENLLNNKRIFESEGL